MKTLFLTNTLLLLFILPNITWAQLIAVSGYINDSVNGAPMENVSIFEANSGIGTISNQNGFYKLILSNRNLDLQITCDGYTVFSKKIVLTADTTLMVSMKPLNVDKIQHDKQDQVQAGVKSEKKTLVRKGLKIF